VASELHAALRELHDAGWYHGDLSPRNVMWRLMTGSSGGVVRKLEDVELVLIDFGMSFKVTSGMLDKSGHTKPYGTKYFLPESQCLQLDARSSDLFQALQMVIHLVLMRGGKASRDIGKDSIDFKSLGRLWLTQNKQWLAFVVTHHVSSCKKVIHDLYCMPCKALFTLDTTELVAKIDKFFSPCPKMLG
jgi:serine/threonine protein kinase